MPASHGKAAGILLRLRALLASPFGFLVGLALGALGGGGSILAVPILVYVAGYSAQEATTVSLVVVGLAAFVGMSSHLRAGRVRVGAGVVFGLCGAGGSLAGSVLNHRLDHDVLLLAFSGLVLVAAWRMLTGCPTCTKVGEQRAYAEARARREGETITAGRLRADAVTIAKFAGAGTLVGFFTGLFGVGGGFIIVPALTLLLGFAMPEAIGTSLLIIGINASMALLGRIGRVDIDWISAIPFALASLIGVVVGSRIAERIPAKTSLRWFAALLVAVAVYTATRSIIAL